MILALELFFNRLLDAWLHTVRVVLALVFAFYIAQALPRGNGVSVCFAFLYRIGYKKYAETWEQRLIHFL